MNKDILKSLKRLERVVDKPAGSYLLESNHKSKTHIDLKEDYDVRIFYDNNEGPERITSRFLKDMSGGIEEELCDLIDDWDNVHASSVKKKNSSTYEFVFSGPFSNITKSDIKDHLDWYFEDCSFYVDNVQISPQEVVITILNDPEEFGYVGFGEEDEEEYF